MFYVVGFDFSPGIVQTSLLLMCFYYFNTFYSDLQIATTIITEYTKII